MNKSSIKAFVHGLGSVLCLLPSHGAGEYRPPRLSSQKNDMAAIAGDFRIIGLDLYGAIHVCDHEQSRSAGSSQHG
jgi:hypothetical protein